VQSDHYLGTVASNANVSAATMSWAPLRLRTIESPGTERAKPPVERHTCAMPDWNRTGRGMPVNAANYGTVTAKSVVSRPTPPFQISKPEKTLVRYHEFWT